MPAILDYIPLVTGRCPANVTADGLVTTLNGLTSIGAITATLTNAAGFTPGTVVLVDTGNLSEVAMISAIAGNVITFADPLTIAHASGVAFSRAVVPDGPPEGSGVVRSPYLAGGQHPEYTPAP